MKKAVFFLVILLFGSLTSSAYITVSDTLSGDETWTTGNTYFVSSTVVIGVGNTLTIEEGVIVKFNTGWKELSTYGGELVVNGTSTNPVIFTSMNDNTVGETISGSTGTPAPGDWEGIYIDAYTYWSGYWDGWTNMSYAELRYGSTFYFENTTDPDYGIVIETSTLDHVYVHQFSGSGFNATGTPLDVSYLDISFCGYGMILWNENTDDFSNVWISNITDPKILDLTSCHIGDLSYWNISPDENQYINIYYSIEDTSILKNSVGLPYLFDEDVDASNLKIEAGTVIKLSGLLIIRDGTLDVNGTPEQPVIFTSYRDDEFGGDTNGDGNASVPEKGDWACVTIDGINSDFAKGTIDWAWFRYGGMDYYGCHSNLEFWGSSNSSYIYNSRIEYSDNYGVDVYKCSPRFKKNMFLYNDSSDVRILDDLSNPVFGTSAYSKGGNVFRKTGLDIWNTTTNDISAKYNDWGSEDSTAISQRLGNNDPSTGSVDFYPWFGNDDDYWYTYDKTAIENAGVYHQDLIPYNDVPAGTVILYQTGESRYGKMKILQRTQTSMTLWWETYNSDGTTYSAGTNLSLSSSGDNDLCELDRGIRGTFFNSQDDCEFYINSDGSLISMPGTKFLIVYSYCSYATHGGTSSSNEIWGAGTHYIDSHFVVQAGDTLVIEAGAIVKFATNAYMDVLGTVIAQGESKDNPIWFTSANDDLHGCIIDGSTGNPQPGDWRYISHSGYYEKNGKYRFCHFAYGGDGSSGMVSYSTNSTGYFKQCTVERSSHTGLYVYGAEIEVDSCTFQENTYHGIEYLYYSTVRLNNSTFLDNGIYAVSAGGCNFWSYCNNNTATGNQLNGIVIFSLGNNNGQRLVNHNSMPFIIYGNLWLGSGKTLYLGGGAHTSLIKMNDGSEIYLNGGRLVAYAATITSLKDDSQGGDTNNDGNATSPAPGDWKGIHILYSKDSDISQCHLKYGGSSTAEVYFSNNAGGSLDNTSIEYSQNHGVQAHSAPLDIWACHINNNGKSGLYLYNSDSVIVRNSDFNNNAQHGINISYNSSFLEISGNEMNNNGEYAVYCDGSAQLKAPFTNNEMDGNAMDAVVISSLNWNKRQDFYPVTGTSSSIKYSYVFLNNVQTYNSDTAEFHSHTVVKFAANKYINSRGTIIARHTRFTSLHDDNAGGDTENDGSATTPAKGDWQYIGVDQGGYAFFDTCAICYAGGGNNSAVRYYVDAQGTIQNSFVRYSAADGISKNYSGNVKILNNVISHNDRYGVYVYGQQDTLQINGNNFDQNGSDAIRLVSTVSTDIYNNTFTGNGGYPVSFNSNCVINDQFSGNISSGNLMEGFAINGLKDNAHNILYFQANLPFIFTNSMIFYSASDTMEIQSSAMIKFLPDVKLEFRGTLLTHGGIFTSIKDDVTGGDTNNDGNATTPAPGDWKGIEVFNGKAELHGGVFQYAGAGNTPALDLYGSNSYVYVYVDSSAYDGLRISNAQRVTVEDSHFIGNARYGMTISGTDTISINNSNFKGNGSHGIVVYSSAPDIDNSNFENNGGYPVYFTSGSVINKEFSGNSTSGNLYEGFAINAFDNYSHQILYYQENIPFIFPNNIISYSTADTFQIENAVVKLLPDVGIEIRGYLSCNNAVITSIKDDVYGGDSNNDGNASSPAPGDWRSIISYENTAQFVSSRVRYGGAGNSNYAVYFNNSRGSFSGWVEYSASNGLGVYNATHFTLDSAYLVNNSNNGFYCNSADTVNVSNSEFNGNVNNGISVLYCSPDIDDCSFENNGGYPVYFTTGSVINKQFTGNTTSGNLYEGFAVNTFNSNEKNIFYYQDSIPFIFPNSITAYSTDDTVQIENAVLKFLPGVYLELRTHLVANGGVFTSIKDDSYCGDSNNDGSATAPAPGDWRFLEVYNNTCELHDTKLRYGGANNSGILYITSNSSGYIDADVEYSAYYGLRMVNFSDFVVENSRFSNNANTGMYIYNGTTLSLKNSVISNNNDMGIYHYNVDSAIYRGNTITNNAGYGIYVNIWGDAVLNLGNNDPNDKGGNIIKNNDAGANGYQLYNYSALNIKAYYNDWGYNTTAAIDAHIYDDDESSSKGIVYFNPWYVYNLAVDVKAIIEGAFNGTDMNTDLNSLNLIPLAQPFNVAPWNYSGSEAVAVIPNNNVVDWVLVELRDAPDAASAGSGTIIERQAGFLLRDGSIVNVDGISTLSFAANVSENLFVVIHHRNHLEVMSNNALTQTNGIYTYDFTTAVSQAYGNGQKAVAGKAVLYGGDVDADGIIDTDDKTGWSGNAGTAGYLEADMNLDGQSDNIDKNDIWLPNNGISSQVPD